MTALRNALPSGQFALPDIWRSPSANGGFSHSRAEVLVSTGCDLVRRARTSLRAAELGCDASRPLRRDWERVKDDVMRRAVAVKFRAQGDIREILLSTGDERIVEDVAAAAPHDGERSTRPPPSRHRSLRPTEPGGRAAGRECGTAGPGTGTARPAGIRRTHVAVLGRPSATWWKHVIDHGSCR
ncbi:NADAR domain-containing protein [Streptomyces sp. NPDC004237]|uniref:NADAR domain-containing protein n=1 Tax=Streptomyces sp. NPDC004237 TaxID=3154455 RepID=UPI0033B0CBBA